jgi:hypothetical protein
MSKGKNKVAFETEVYVCVSDKLMQQDAEIQYHKSTMIIIAFCFAL